MTKDSYICEILYVTGTVSRKIFNTKENNQEKAREFINNIQREAKPLTIVKTKIRQVYSSDS